MPIRADLRKFYAGAAWQAIRARILARAQNKCENCKRPNATVTEKTRDGFWRLDQSARWRNANGKRQDPPPTYAIRTSRCQLGVAHLNHNPADMSEGNLAALCQSCHLRHDQKHHYASYRRNRAARVGQAWLSDELREAV